MSRSMNNHLNNFSSLKNNGSFLKTFYNKLAVQKINPLSNPVVETYVTKMTTQSNETVHGLTPIGSYNEYPFMTSTQESINGELQKAINYYKNATGKRDAHYIEISYPQDAIPLIIDHKDTIVYNGTTQPRIRSYLQTNYRSLNSKNERNSTNLNREWMEFDVDFDKGILVDYVLDTSLHSKMKDAFYKWMDSEIIKAEGKTQSTCPPYNLHFKFFDKLDGEIAKTGLYEYDYLKDMNGKETGSLLSIFRELYSSKLFLIDDCPPGKYEFSIYNNRNRTLGFESVRYQNTDLKACLTKMRNEFSTSVNRLIEAAIANKLDGNTLIRAFIAPDGKLRRFAVGSLLLPRIIREYCINGKDATYLLPHLDEGIMINPWHGEDSKANAIGKNITPESMPSKAYLPNDSGITIWNSTWMYPFVTYVAKSAGGQNTIETIELNKGSGFNMISTAVLDGGDYSDTCNYSDTTHGMISNISRYSISETARETITSIFMRLEKKNFDIDSYHMMTLNEKNQGRSSDDCYCWGKVGYREWCSENHVGNTGREYVYSHRLKYHDVLGNYSEANGRNGLGELDQTHEWHNNSCGYVKDHQMKIWEYATFGGNWVDENGFKNYISADHHRGKFYITFGGCVNKYGDTGRSGSTDDCDGGCESRWSYYHYGTMSWNEAERVRKQASDNQIPIFFEPLKTYSDEKHKCRILDSKTRYAYRGNFIKDVLKIDKINVSFENESEAKGKFIAANYMTMDKTIYKVDDRFMLFLKHYLIKHSNMLAKRLTAEIQEFYLKNPSLLLPFRVNAGYMQFVKNKIFSIPNTNTYYNVECPITPNVCLALFDKSKGGDIFYKADNPVKGQPLKITQYAFNGGKRQFVSRLFDPAKSVPGIDSIYQTLFKSFSITVTKTATQQENIAVPYIKIPDCNNPQDYLTKNLFEVNTVPSNAISGLALNSHALIFDLSKLTKESAFKFTDNAALNTAISNAGKKETISMTAPLVFVHRNDKSVIEFVFDSGKTSGNIQLHVCRKESSKTTSVGTMHESGKEYSNALVINKTNISEDLNAMGLPSILKSRFNI